MQRSLTVLPRLLFTMRTADRTPKSNYVGRTLASLVANGVAPADIHVFATDPDTRWLPDGPAVNLHAPASRRTPNENGLAPIALLDTHPADWIILSEDDLEWCANPIETMARWLQDHAQPDVLVYRFFAFDRLTARGAHVASAPLWEQKGSQVIALRAADARRLETWADAHRTTWRPAGAPFQNRPHDGFDKLVGYWALSEGRAPVGFVSRPFFARHIGLESSLHRIGVGRDQDFSPTPYPEAACV